MSDLISRSELLEEIKSLIIVLNGKQIFSDDAKDTVLRIIDEQPTAYDIDKVVEEIIEEAHNTIVDFKLDKYIYTRKAIEIVKQGGVADDVCEWVIVDRPHNLPIYNTSCGKIRLQYTTGVDIYCNGCGNKIKVKQNDN